MLKNLYIFNVSPIKNPINFFIYIAYDIYSCKYVRTTNMYLMIFLSFNYRSCTLRFDLDWRLKHSAVKQTDWNQRGRYICEFLVSLKKNLWPFFRVRQKRASSCVMIASHGGRF